MMDSDDDKGKPSSGKGRGRGRGRPPGRKKGRKPKTVKEEKEIHQMQNENLLSSLPIISPKFDSSSDSELTSPSISFVNTSSKLLHQNAPLNWEFKVNLIGEKVVNPRIHCCDKCELPILVYGRMIPCKHVVCFSCAKENQNICLKCNDKVVRVEKTGLGTVFMCQTNSCKRTYLSQRDLQAHIQHRHMKKSIANQEFSIQINSTNKTGQPFNIQSASVYQSHSIPVAGSRSNLISVPIQDEQISKNQAGKSNAISSHSVGNYHSYNASGGHMQWQQNSFQFRQSWPTMPIQPGTPYSLPYNRPYFPQ